MIEVKNLTKKYGGHTAIEDLTFTVEEGKIYGFLGPNGAGKSTTMNIITGCLSATSGTVSIDGHDIFEEPLEAKRKIGYLPEIPPVYPDMTPEEYLRFVAKAKGVARDKIAAQVDAVIAETDIGEMRDRLIRNLSKGYRQRVGIAQAMLGEPRVIILDEPTVGLDPLQIIEIRDLIKTLGKERTVILSSHILSEVSAVCDYALIISHGHLVASDTIENLGRDATGTTLMHLTVKAPRAALEQTLLQLDCAKRTTVTDASGDGLCEVEIETDRDVDLREDAFRLLAGAGFIILSSTTEQHSLEDVFIKLTGDEEEAAAGSAAAVNGPKDGDGDGDDDNGDNDDGEDDGEAYKPQFSQKR